VPTSPERGHWRQYARCGQSRLSESYDLISICPLDTLEMSLAPRMTLSFGDYEIDVERRELRRAKAPVRIEPQVFDLLVYLVPNCDRVVRAAEFPPSDIRSQSSGQARGEIPRAYSAFSSDQAAPDALGMSASPRSRPNLRTAANRRGVPPADEVRRSK
jgi:hypothetical protein